MMTKNKYILYTIINSFLYSIINIKYSQRKILYTIVLVFNTYYRSQNFFKIEFEPAVE